MNSFKSLERAIDILFSFSRIKTEQTPLEIAESVGIPIPSVYRFLKTFEQKGLMEKNPSTGMYSLGYDLLILESAVRNKIGLESITRPIIDRISSETHETVQITILNKDHGLLLFSEESPNPPRFVPEFGFPMPLYAGSTVQIMMAYLPEETQEQIISKGLQKFGPNSITSANQLRIRLKEIKEVGYAVSNEEFYPGSKGVALPIFIHGKKIIGSLAVSAPMERFEEQKEKEVLKLLSEQAAIISQRISIQNEYNTKLF
jgi:DNA-binding IclR family transcriptional regulator